jgi:1,2-diacylglycerol 3-beta-galactosyltransferase
MSSQAGKPQITFLFSDTGGGHRAASEAIIEALHCEFGASVETNMVDFLKEYAPPPFNHLPEAYPEMVRAPELWGVMWNTSNGRPQARIVTSTLWPYVKKAALKLVNEHASDLIVSAHPLANSFVLKALGKKRPPFICVVTDMVTTHALWFDPRLDLILVPTEMARDHAIKCGMEAEKVVVVGQPVPANCTTPPGDKYLLRQKFGWPGEKPIALLVGGGEGMGPLAETAEAIDAAEVDLCLVVVTGRNARLEAELREKTWRKQVLIYGYTHEMPGFMRAADMIVTKAGPGTIAEALVAGLPIILYSRIPKQEDGNVDYVIEEQVGAWAPEPEAVVAAIRSWINRPEERERIKTNCLRAARPDASRQIARILGKQVGLTNREEKIPAEQQDMTPLP